MPAGHGNGFFLGLGRRFARRIAAQSQRSTTQVSCKITGRRRSKCDQGSKTTTQSHLVEASGAGAPSAGAAAGAAGSAAAAYQ